MRRIFQSFSWPVNCGLLFDSYVPLLQRICCPPHGRETATTFFAAPYCSGAFFFQRSFLDSLTASTLRQAFWFWSLCQASLSIDRNSALPDTVLLVWRCGSPPKLANRRGSVFSIGWPRQGVGRFRHENTNRRHSGIIRASSPSFFPSARCHLFFSHLQCRCHLNFVFPNSLFPVCRSWQHHSSAPRSACCSRGLLPPLGSHVLFRNYFSAISVRSDISSADTSF